jgi:hypothetical protein
MSSVAERIPESLTTQIEWTPRFSFRRHPSFVLFKFPTSNDGSINMTNVRISDVGWTVHIYHVCLKCKMLILKRQWERTRDYASSIVVRNVRFAMELLITTRINFIRNIFVCFENQKHGDCKLLAGSVNRQRVEIYPSRNDSWSFTLTNL